MKILIQHDDGSQTIQFEVGDRVRVTRDCDSMWGFGKVGDLATVVEQAKPDDPRPSIAFVGIRTDAMVEGGWGVITVPPWFIELVEVQP